MKTSISFNLEPDELNFLETQFDAHNSFRVANNMSVISYDRFVSVYFYGLFRDDYVFHSKLISSEKA